MVERIQKLVLVGSEEHTEGVVVLLVVESYVAAFPPGTVD